MVHGFASITHRGDQVVSGMALNIVVAGLGPTLANAWFHQAGRVPVTGAGAAASCPSTCRSPTGIGTVPVLGPVLRRRGQRP